MMNFDGVGNSVFFVLRSVKQFVQCLSTVSEDEKKFRMALLASILPLVIKLDIGTVATVSGSVFVSER